MQRSRRHETIGRAMSKILTGYSPAKRIVALIATAVPLALGSVAQAAVSTVTVSGFGDGGGPCSAPVGSTESCPTLRTAEAAAEGASSPSNVPTIQLQAGTYALSDAPLTVGAAMTIQGVGMNGAPSGTTIEQTDGTTEVLDAVAASGTVTLKSLEITGGHNAPSSSVGSACGGGIAENRGSMTLDSVLVTGNKAIGPPGTGDAGFGGSGEGGGVCDPNGADLTVIDSAITNNVATSGIGSPPTHLGGTGGQGGETDGGGIMVYAASPQTNVAIIDSAISDNDAIGGLGGSGGMGSSTGGYGGQAIGGGLELYGPTATLDGVTVSGNSASGNAGGPGATGGHGGDGKAGGVFAEGPMTMHASTVTANHASGGAPGGSGGAAGGGAGGGVFADSGTATIVNSTVSQNEAHAGAVAGGESGGTAVGGGLFAYVDSPGVLASDTFAGNSATGSGGVAAQGGNISDVPLPPSGPGGSSLSLMDTVVVGGTSTQAGSSNCGLDNEDPLVDGGGNLEDDASSQCGLSASKGDVLVAPGTPVLAGSLANNGGPTQTLALTAGSPALAKGSACVDPSISGSPALTVDQRGLPRSPPCDIGAFQHQPPAGGAAHIVGTALVGRNLPCTHSGFTGDGLGYSFAWLRNGTQVAIGSAYTIGPADAGHSLVCRVTATGTYGGTASASSASVAVPAYRVSHAHQSHRRWREGGKPHARPPIGTSFTFTLNEPGPIKLTFIRSHRRTTLHLNARQGKNTFKFRGKLPHGRRLAPGRYSLKIAAGSSVATLTFTVVAA